MVSFTLRPGRVLRAQDIPIYICFQWVAPLLKLVLSKAGELISGPTISTVTAYPAGASDIDGLGMDDQGNIYLMEDEPNPIHIYNLGTM